MNIEEALKALAAEDAALEAAPYVEARLLEAYRRKRPRAAWRRALPWAIAAAAVFVVLFARFPVRRTSGPAGGLPVARPAGRLAADPEVRRTMPPPKLVRVAPREPVETATEFFPLLEIAPPFERGELVRVTVPAAAMRRVGIPVREELLQQPVQADILFGQEGLARAIRFVRLEQ